MYLINLSPTKKKISIFSRTAMDKLRLPQIISLMHEEQIYFFKKIKRDRFWSFVHILLADFVYKEESCVVNAHRVSLHLIFVLSSNCARLYSWPAVNEICWPYLCVILCISNFLSVFYCYYVTKEKFCRIEPTPKLNKCETIAVNLWNALN